MADERKVKRLLVTGNLAGGVPPGGKAGQVLTKKSDADGDATWEDPVGGELYDGPAVVTPSQETQTLETAGKVMGEDVSVQPIPYAEVSNAFGGKTVTIGG